MPIDRIIVSAATMIELVSALTTPPKVMKNLSEPRSNEGAQAWEIQPPRSARRARWSAADRSARAPRRPSARCRPRTGICRHCALPRPRAGYRRWRQRRSYRRSLRRPEDAQEEQRAPDRDDEDDDGHRRGHAGFALVELPVVDLADQNRQRRAAERLCHGEHLDGGNGPQDQRRLQAGPQH